MTSPEVRVLVSSGRHPVSGRSGAAREDARAVEMALALAGEGVTLLHAGDPADASLRYYLGMFHEVPGLPSVGRVGRLDLLSMPAESDATSLLAEQLRHAGASLVLTGMRSEIGEGSGLLPYLLAERLGWNLVAGVAAIEHCDSESATILQALPQGQRRRLSVRLPCIATVDRAAPAPRQSAHGPARRGQIRVIEPQESAGVALDEPRGQWRFEPARVRPKRLKVVKGGSARERMRAAASTGGGGGGRVLSDLDPEAAADELIRYLESERVLQ
ncbi:electron transfer flavoprotein beta subunit [Kushneria sinocarnis]|uniref:Electron transfer flavoprotein beta subunit n=1 Tax=Kushneria sinocarnis TaxID=595502 RepID=A0A420WZ10_9GAMM|nr:electron transfer flavoprotein subunit beta [Kushneria sinocarnis]RKR06573.1 electron transfer flavoprotein beta subunit [Kushneria sinocarnis]